MVYMRMNTTGFCAAGTDSSASGDSAGVHGASGLSEQDVQHCIRRGILK